MPAPTAAYIEALQNRRQALERERVQLQARRELALDKLKELQETAQVRFGVTTLEGLRELNRTWTAENETNLQQFEADLTALEEQLQASRITVQNGNG